MFLLLIGLFTSASISNVIQKFIIFRARQISDIDFKMLLSCMNVFIGIAILSLYYSDDISDIYG